MEGIRTIASAYECEDMGQTYILVWHQFLYFGDQIPVTLLNGNHIRAHGYAIEDVPCQYDENSGHCITTSCGLNIPMKLKGILSYFPMRKPTDQELTPNYCKWIDMMPDKDWDPHSEDFAMAEEQAQDRNVSATGTTNATRAPMCGVTNIIDEEQAHYFTEKRGNTVINIAEDNALHTHLVATTTYSNNTNAGN
jgi:hypothetical protein